MAEFTQDIQVSIDIDLCCDDCGRVLDVVKHGNWYGVVPCPVCIKEAEDRWRNA